MSKTQKILAAILIVFLACQLIRPKEIYESVPQKDLAGLPQGVNNVLRASCFDCHSSEANLKWFDKITPVNFLVASHIRDGRQALDFSKWDSLKKPQQDATIFYALNNILSGNMPIKSYTALHPAAVPSYEGIQELKNYAISISSIGSLNKSALHTKENTALPFAPQPAVQKGNNALNSQSYIPNYRSWKAISTTDRFDNGTLRIIYANDIAVKAIQEKNNNPWPDGSAFAKAAWKQQQLKNGSVAMGDFVQVEFMVKNAEKYKQTAGWGWSRWKGNDLKPYGKTADFDMECVNCHKPMKERDYVFTTPLYLKNFNHQP